MKKVSNEEALENDLSIIPSGISAEDELDGIAIQEIIESNNLSPDDVERLTGRPYLQTNFHMRSQNSRAPMQKPVYKKESPLEPKGKGYGRPFVQHAFETELSGVPTVFFSEQAFKDMMVLVTETRTEVGWLGTVRREDGDFYIDEIFVPGQEVSGRTTDMTTAGLAELTKDLIKQKRAAEVCNNLLFWGHSHVDMGVEPSKTDDDQMDKFSYNDFFIRGIFNKRGDCKIWIYLYEYGLIIEDCPWAIFVEAEEKRVDQLRKLVEKNASYEKPYYVSSFGGGGLSGASIPGENDDWDDFFLGFGGGRRSGSRDNNLPDLANL